MPALDLEVARSVNMGFAGMTPKTVYAIPNISPPAFSLDGDMPFNLPPLTGGPDSGFASDGPSSRWYGQRAVSAKRSHRSSWTGLRISPAAKHGAAKRCPPLAMRRRVVSAPNLQAMGHENTSNHEAASTDLNRLFRPFANDYALDQTTLGTGGYAVVKKAIHKSTAVEYAIKIMPIGNGRYSSSESEEEDDDDEDDEDPDGCLADPLTFDEIMNEIELVQKLKHNNVVNINEYFVNAGTCYIVMDLLQGPELMQALQSRDHYSEADVKLIMASLLDAVAYLHTNDVTHRDLKLENCVLARKDDLSSVTIVDFGLAKAARAREQMEDVCGTVYYYSPEIVDMKPYGPSVDEWALGVSMYILLTGSYPFYDDDEVRNTCD